MSLLNKEYIILKSKDANEAFSKLLYKATLPEDSAQFTSSEILELANMAVEALYEYNDKPVVNFVNKYIEKFGKEILILTIVNSNKQFLFDSVQQAIKGTSTNLYMVAHPVIDIIRSDANELIITANQGEAGLGAGAKRLSVMQFALINLNDIERTKLRQEITKSLEDVEDATSAWHIMLEKAKSMKELWQASSFDNDVAATLVEFLDWLIEGNFTFLSLEEYDIIDNNMQIRNNLGAKLSGQALAVLPSDFVTIAKADQRSHVHRFTWLDDIKILSPDKKQCLRLLGLFTSSAYNHSIFRVPYIKDKANEIIERLGYNPEDHSGKNLVNILEQYPRDELFWLSVEQLSENANKILALEEKPSLRVITHIDKNSPLVTALVYLPRSQYNINNCENIGKYLLKSFSGDFYEYSTFFVNSAITRVYYVVHREVKMLPKVNEQKLKKDIAELTRTWHDSLALYAQQNNISDDSVKLASKFSPIYRDNLSPEEALDDAQHILKLDSNKSLFVKFCQVPNINDDRYVTLKLYHRESALMLSQRVPLLENMGFTVIDEQTFELIDENNNQIYMHNMCLKNTNNAKVDLSDGGKLLSATFEEIWSEEIDDDAYNKLCQSAKLAPREILILRIYGRYMQQIGTPYSQEHLAAALANYSDIARDIYSIFYYKFAPNLDKQESDARVQELNKAIQKNLQKVPNLDDDFILRRYLNLLNASLRTNAFAVDKNGKLADIIAIKFNPKIITDLPDPKPYREIFVYGMLVEGVHLRFGPVARGGIRWSDRALDYRTEILGLVKAQQVKNVVIVPVGSKGGFYPHQLPDTNDRAEIAEAARQAYIGYINAMLSITDNLVDRKIVPPKDVTRIDGDDPYFVVAADKGTASFSDTANAISAEYNFWLDDAFASGGSDGYDHKKMAITAKGAWEAVKRHFRELFDRDIQSEDFTVAGIGDMSGDVFGNGMLLSKHIKLIAAFDHRDIFIDPNPDPKTSYEERKRLFNMERSSWQDYDRNKISKGGGVYSRKLKEINLSQEAAQAIGLDTETAAPFEVIKAILKSKVDLFWFGGIGTYVRASNESNTDVGDRTNDKIRITGKEFGAKIIGEGANLGLTQRGRIEYSMANGRCNTDAIDNSAGVNCSDVEVNIKIALADAMANNMLTRPQRNELLKAMTDEVARLVLRNNYLQSLIISLSERRASRDISQQKIFIENLEREGLLDRRVEILPENSELTQRILHGQGLTRPELSVIIAYAKLVLQNELSKSDFIKDNYFKTRLINYFPSLMHEKYKDVIERHQLREPIIATQIANSVINFTGATFIFCLAEKLDLNIIEIVKSYIYIYDGFDIEHITNNIDALDNKISGEVQNNLYSDVIQYLSQAIEFFVSTSCSYPQLIKDFSIKEIISKISQAHKSIFENSKDILPNSLYASYQAKKEEYISEGIKSDLADQLCALKYAVRLLNILPIAVQENIDIMVLGKVYFDLHKMFNADQIEEAGHAIPAIDYYDSLAVSMACDSISHTLRKLSVDIVEKNKESSDPIEVWINKNKIKIESIRQRIGALIEGDLNISRFVVASAMMQELLKI